MNFRMKLANRQNYRWGPRLRPEIGRRYGKLVILGASPSPGRSRCICQCDCGNVISVDLYHLRNRTPRSCGCRRGGKCKPAGEAAFNRVFYWYRKHALDLDRQFDLTPQYFRELITSACHYCGVMPSRVVRARGGNFVYNGIDRVSSEWGYTTANSVSCCFECNAIKTRFPYCVFIARIKKIYEHLRLGEQP